MLSLGERCQRKLAMQVGPRADEHSIDIGRLDDLPPVVGRASESPFLLNAATTLRRAVADRDQLDVRHFCQVRKMPLLADPSSADDAEADWFGNIHRVTTLVTRPTAATKKHACKR